jgi:peptidoglycan/xylan/chitin deacetylase (PgdA/CDA1 family)
MTRYIAAYDTERPTGLHGPAPSCVEACEAIVAMHRKHDMPATFFVVGRVLEETPDRYRRLLDDPLFEIASHTWSHRMLRDNPFCGPAIEPDAIREEIFRGKEAIEKHFPDRRCRGLRPGCSFVDGLSGAPEVLAWVAEAGYEYVSSMAWGPDYTLPAPLNQAFTYADDGFLQLSEYPCHGWHDNVLKTMSKPGYWKEPRRLLGFPPLYPEAIPPGPLGGPEDEFRYNNKVFIDHAVTDGLDFVSLIWHPWSLALFDPDMQMLDMTFNYVREQGLKPTTYAAMHDELGAHT